MDKANTFKILAYVHTFNSSKFIDTALMALSRQTYPVPEILLVDNASADGTLDRAFPANVTIIRNKQNLGTSGAVAIGMEYALAHGYDWIYIVDSDSLAEPDAIEKLIESYLSLSPDLQASTWLMNSVPVDSGTGFLHHGCVFTKRGVKIVNPPAEPSRYQCHAHIWSGSLYRLEAVSKVGLPDSGLVLDWGDLIYGYEGLIRGYTGFVDQSSIVRHNMHSTRGKSFLSQVSDVYSSAPIRAYYFWRNGTYFWLYQYRRTHYAMPIVTHFFRFCLWMTRLVLFQRPLAPSVRACLRGAWAGLNGHIETRY